MVSRYEIASVRIVDYQTGQLRAKLGLFLFNACRILLHANSQISKGEITMAKIGDSLEEKLDEIEKQLEKEYNEEDLKLFNNSKKELVSMVRSSAIIISSLLTDKFDLKRRIASLEEKLETLKVFLKSPAFEKEVFQKRKTEGRKEGILGTVVFVVLPILAWVKFVVLAE